jgi:hypothetical protein
VPPLGQEGSVVFFTDLLLSWGATTGAHSKDMRYAEEVFHDLVELELDRKFGWVATRGAKGC